ncbi:MAG: hypothetical protein OK456_07270 [Thaumarchaeota archaeon]|nr:hypothetical protein [Nitrososphaerota archaeon]
MPVNSLSGSLSTAVYFAAMFLLLFAVASPLEGAYQDANTRAAQQISSGLAAQINDLSPGMESVLVLRSSLGVSVTVHIAGGEVEASVDGATAASPTRWTMDDSTLTGGSEYTVTIHGASGTPSSTATESYYGVIEPVTQP